MNREPQTTEGQAMMINTKRLMKLIDADCKVINPHNNNGTINSITQGENRAQHDTKMTRRQIVAHTEYLAQRLGLCK